MICQHVPEHGVTVIDAVRRLKENGAVCRRKRRLKTEKTEMKRQRIRLSGENDETVTGVF